MGGFVRTSVSCLPLANHCVGVYGSPSRGSYIRASVHRLLTETTPVGDCPQRVQVLPPHMSRLGAPLPIACLIHDEHPTGMGRGGGVWPSTASRRRLTTSGAHCGVRGHKQPLPGRSETSALGAFGKELIKGLLGRFKRSWGWRHGSAVTQSSPCVGYGESALRAIALKYLLMSINYC